MKKQYDITTMFVRFSFLLLLCSLISFHVYGQQVPKKVPGGRGYLEYLPPGYSTSTALYPCIVFLHGAGERGDGSPAELTRVTANGTPKFIKNGATMCFTVNGVNECFIVLSPQQTTAYWSWTGAVIPFMKWALANYRIDPSRLYLTGLSMGGGWDTAYGVLNNPNIIAAFSPHSTTGSYPGGQIVAGFKMPVWDFHGDKDNAFTLFQGKQPINGMNAAGANPAPIWTIVPGGGHGGSTWDKTFSPTHTYYNPNIYEWFLTHKLGIATPKPPTVGAGADKSITLPISSTSLTGTASDPDGTITSRLWAQSSGPLTATITSPSTLTPTLTGMTQAGAYVFSLTATDNSGLSATDLVTVQVQPAPNPKPPTANAGADKIITEPDASTTFSGSGADTDGTIAGYSWSQTSGPNTATLVNNTSSTLTANGLIVGSYSFTLTVTDNSGLTGFDQVSVTVLALPPNAPPSANAGEDKNITKPNDLVILNGTGTDTDGTIASYSWSQTSGPSTSTISSASTTNTNITNLAEGVYVFTLTVTDNLGSTNSDQVIVTVFPEPPNTPPTANAGTNQSITLPDNTTLNGSGNDPDGTIATYAWVQVSGPNTALLSNSSSATTSITNLIAGNYLFTLTVTDDKGSQGSDQVLIIVLPVPPNQPPTANAGLDNNITSPIATVTVNGTGSDTDGTITAYTWIQQSGPSTATLLTPAQANTIINVLIEGVYTFEFTVTDDKGSTGSDLVTITVFPPANLPPSASAGADQNITFPLNSVAFTGSGIDTDGTISSFLWEQVSGPSVATISNTTGAATNVNNLIVGIYTFSITVTDNDGAKSTDQVGITVLPEPPNQPPVANAGTDKNLTLPDNSVTLNGSGTDADGTIVSYLWNFIVGPGEGNSGALNQPSLDLADLDEGIYIFELIVTDNRGATSTDEVKIFVNASNQPPVANAGANRTITLPNTSLTLTGSATDADGTISSYVWEQISGPATAIFNDPFAATVDVTGLIQQGIYVFSLRVADDEGIIDTDQVTVLVNPPPPNTPPVATVGPDWEITLPTPAFIEISGSGTDSDGTIVTYTWSQLSGPNTATTTPVNQPTIQFSGFIAGSYVFRLTVTDNLGAVGQKDVNVKVNPQPANVPPIANAGSNNQIILPQSDVTLSGSGSDSDGTITQYQWQQISGPSNATFLTGSSASTVAQPLVEGIYVFRLIVTDNKGVASFDEVAITVKPIPFNLPPIANAGGNKILTIPTISTTLTGSATDSDGSISGYTWSQISGPSTVSPPNVTLPSLNLDNLLEGIYVFRLTVIDNNGSTGFDEINIRVQPTPSNQPPTADAGPNKIITLLTDFTTFSGLGTDPDGTITTLVWTKVSGLAATLSGEGTATLSASDLIEGTYIFRLTVTDNVGAQGFDEVNVRVNPEPPNTGPQANAGGDITIALQTNSTTITGSGTDIDGTISNYVWSQSSGPGEAILSGAPNPVIIASSLVAGVYIFRLSVTDNDGATGFDDVRVIVNPEPNNIPPIVNAGSDRSIIMPPNTISLSGNATDNDGTIASSIWNQVNGPNIATIATANSLNTLVSGLQLGTYIFSLSATDNRGGTGFDEVIVNVSSNVPPTAFAGDPIEVILPDSDTLLVGGGSDADGSISSYNWTQVSGEDAVTAPLNQSNLSVSGLAVGTYVFRLTVTDNNGATNFDDTQIDVRAVTINLPPIAHAGKDSTLLLPLNTIQLQGSGPDPEGTIVSFQWAQISGPDESVISDNTTSDPTVSGLIEGTYVFRLTVTDIGGATTADEVSIDVRTIANLPPVAIAGSDSTIILPTTSIQLQGSGTDSDGTISSYSWNQFFGPSTSSISDIAIPNPVVADFIEGVYVFELTVTDNNNAFSKAQVTITVINFEIEKVVFPKVFSPNGDNNNDKWTWANSALFDGCELNIFNRLGKKVFGMTSYDNSWDGTFNGTPLEAEGYYFIIKCGDGKQTSGGVRIVR